ARWGGGGGARGVPGPAVVLGYIGPAYFRGGRIKLAPEQAAAAVRTRIAEPLGLEVEQAAYAILAVANEHMVAAIRDITINEGLDPRDSVVVAGGGASGPTIARPAREVGRPTVPC